MQQRCEKPWGNPRRGNVGAMARPDAPAFDVRTAEIDVKTAGTEKSPLLLERVAPKGPGVEGTRYKFPDCPVQRWTPHPSRQKA